jgi:dihydroorotate dehydrogenase (fumarate)
MDLATRYMGLELKNPLVASASPISEKVDAIRRLEDAGVAAVVLFSLFEEQIERNAAALEQFLALTTDSHGEATSYLPRAHAYDAGPV